MDQIDFLQLQQLSRYNYNTSVSRAQPRILWESEDKMCAMTFNSLSSLKYRSSVFVRGLDEALPEQWSEVNSHILDFNCMTTRTIVVGKSLFAFKEKGYYSAVEIYRYDNIMGTEKSKERLIPLGEDPRVLNFALTAIQDRFIMLTGGASRTP